jgi:hypothetical protein
MGRLACALEGKDGLRLQNPNRSSSIGFPAAEGHLWRPSLNFGVFWGARRSGKSRMAGALCVYEALLKKHKLVPGETRV